MRKIILSEFISLDGVMEAPGPDGSSFEYAGWTFPFWCEEIGKYKYDELFVADALLLGRVTYEGFAKAWPTMQSAGDFGERMNNIQKFVISTSLAKADWNNTNIIKENVTEEIKKLKEMPGNDLLIAGSGELANFLLKEGLIEEIRLLVYPIILGKGKRLFKDGTNQKLKLLSTREFSTGVAALHYEMAK